MEPVENDNDGLISMLDESKKGHQIAISLLGETGMNGYTRIKKHIDTALQLPSYYMVTKGRPKVLPFTLEVMKDIDLEESKMSIIETEDINDTSDITNTVPTNITDGTEYLEAVLRLCSQSNDILEGAKLDGNYSKYIAMMENKHKINGRLIDSQEQVVSLDSINGAEHIKSKKNHKYNFLLVLHVCTIMDQYKKHHSWVIT